jgi:hypothetical protein
MLKRSNKDPENIIRMYMIGLNLTCLKAFKLSIIVLISCVVVRVEYFTTCILKKITIVKCSRHKISIKTNVKQFLFPFF